MKKILKMFIVLELILFSLNIVATDGYAANDSVPNAEPIEELDNFYNDFELTEDHLQEDGTYGKYFKITLPEDGLLELILRGPIMSIYNENLELMEKVPYFNYGSYFYSSLSKLLEAGTYYIYVESTQPIDAYIWGSFVKFFEEKEPNNQLEHANEITDYLLFNNFGYNIKGAFDSADDVDYYKFTLTNELTNVYLSFDYEKEISFLLLDSNGDEIEPVDNWYNEAEYRLSSGTYYIRIEGSEDDYEKNYLFAVSGETRTPPVNPNDVIVRNNIGADTITLKNLVVGRKYRIRWENGSISFKSASTEKTIPVGELNKEGGIIEVEACDDNAMSCSDIVEIEYGPEPLGVTPAVDESQVTVKNNMNQEDVITFTNLEIGTKYTIYKDQGKSTILAEFTADNTTKAVTIEQLGKKAGSIYVTATKPNYAESELTEIKYAKESMGQTPAISAKDVTVKNNYKADDVISFKNLNKGWRYYVYTNKSLTKESKLTSFTASSKNATVSVDQLGVAKGTLYIVVKAPDYDASKATPVNYDAEQLPALSAKNVVITNNIGSKDKIALKGLTKGFTYTIYTDATQKKPLTSFTADGSTKTLTVKLSDKAGAVYVVVSKSKSDYKPSTATKVTYKAEPTPALAAKNVKITNKKKGKDTITLSGLKKGTTYVIYKDAKKKTKLATIKATKSTHSVKVNLDTKGGKVYITAQAPGYGVSSTTTVSYKKAK